LCGILLEGGVEDERADARELSRSDTRIEGRGKRAHVGEARQLEGEDIAVVQGRGREGGAYGGGCGAADGVDAAVCCEGGR
jgi:hypothetical protein